MQLGACFLLHAVAPHVSWDSQATGVSEIKQAGHTGHPSGRPPDNPEQAVKKRSLEGMCWHGCFWHLLRHMTHVTYVQQLCPALSPIHEACVFFVFSCHGRASGVCSGLAKAVSAGSTWAVPGNGSHPYEGSKAMKPNGGDFQKGAPDFF